MLCDVVHLLWFQVCYECLQPAAKRRCIHKSRLKWEQHHWSFHSELLVGNRSEEGGFTRIWRLQSTQFCFMFFIYTWTLLWRGFVDGKQATVETSCYNKHLSSWLMYLLKEKAIPAEPMWENDCSLHLVSACNRLEILGGKNVAVEEYYATLFRIMWITWPTTGRCHWQKTRRKRRQEAAGGWRRHDFLMTRCKNKPIHVWFEFYFLFTGNTAIAKLCLFLITA